MAHSQARIVRDFCIPQDRARVGQGNLLTLGELVRARKVEQVVVLLFGETLPSRLDGSLDPSVLTLDRFRHIDPAELLDPVIAHPMAERQVPGL